MRTKNKRATKAIHTAALFPHQMACKVDNHAAMQGRPRNVMYATWAQRRRHVTSRPGHTARVARHAPGHVNGCCIPAQVNGSCIPAQVNESCSNAQVNGCSLTCAGMQHPLTCAGMQHPLTSAPNDWPMTQRPRADWTQRRLTHAL